MVIAAITANSIRAILDYSLDNSPVPRTMDHVLGLLIGFGNQIWVLFYGRGPRSLDGLAESSDRGLIKL